MQECACVFVYLCVRVSVYLCVRMPVCACICMPVYACVCIAEKTHDWYGLLLLPGVVARLAAHLEALGPTALTRERRHRRLGPLAILLCARVRAGLDIVEGREGKAAYRDAEPQLTEAAAARHIDTKHMFVTTVCRARGEDHQH